MKDSISNYSLSPEQIDNFMKDIRLIDVSSLKKPLPLQFYEEFKFEIIHNDPPIVKLEQPELKYGIGGWYERNMSKITLFSIVSAIIIGIIAIYEAYLISK